ncbi:MAG: hypothetical protein AABZ11_10110, partial [Nitrospinota bacterium]
MTEKKMKTWWPHHVLKAGSVLLIMLVVLFILVTKFQIPDDSPGIVPMPDDGMEIPGPEWYFLLFWQPFWFFKGPYKHLLSYAAIVPTIIFFLFTLLPFIRIPFLHKKGIERGQVEGEEHIHMGLVKKIIVNSPILFLAIIFLVSVYKSGHQAKIYGCDACHNSRMGIRMYMPPLNVVEYYRVDRARQIQSGKYRAGKTSGVDEKTGRLIQAIGGVETYKDANWQMRHMYEPTFT